MSEWIRLGAEAIASSAERDLAALVDISSPSGDAAAAERVMEAAVTMLPAGAVVQRVPCSTPDHAEDLIATVHGTGALRLLLVGHVDTVVAHAAHEPLNRDEDRLIGSGSIDMKGGDVLALGVLRALAQRTGDFAAVSLLLVCDEEWRLGEFTHTARFGDYDACLCFEAGELDAEGRDAVVVKRKAAGTIRVTAQGRSAHSGASPEKGVNALLALAAAAQAVAGANDPDGPHRVTAVPTVLRSGDALNVVPAEGELICDVRADSETAFADVLKAIPREVGGATLTAENLRHWPGMDHRSTAAPVLADAAALLGREIVPAQRGGASDCSHFAAWIGICIDGLGPLGGLAHAPGEFVLAASLRSRAEVALAITEAILRRNGGDVLYTPGQP